MLILKKSLPKETVWILRESDYNSTLRYTNTNEFIEMDLIFQDRKWAMKKLSSIELYCWTTIVGRFTNTYTPLASQIKYTMLQISQFKSISLLQNEYISVINNNSYTWLWVYLSVEIFIMKWLFQVMTYVIFLRVIYVYIFIYAYRDHCYAISNFTTHHESSRYVVYDTCFGFILFILQ